MQRCCPGEKYVRVRTHLASHRNAQAPERKGFLIGCVCNAEEGSEDGEPEPGDRRWEMGGVKTIQNTEYRIHLS